MFVWSRICKWLRPAQRYCQFRFKKAILSCTLYAWNDDELIAPPPTDPVQFLFCILYAWDDDELIAPLPRTRFVYYFAPYCMLGTMMN